MSENPHTELQRKLLQEIVVLTEKKLKLEAALRKADARHWLLLQSFARNEIEAYRKQLLFRRMSSPRKALPSPYAGRSVGVS